MIPTSVWAFILFATSGLYDEGRLSMYEPQDGHHSEKLCCGGMMDWTSVHIAYRRWWKVGCGRKVWVCADATGRCALATVRDAGPFGVYTGTFESSKKMLREGRLRVASRAERKRGRPRPGWKWRGQTDLSWALWRKLGKPKFLSRVRLYFLPKRRPRCPESS